MGAEWQLLWIVIGAGAGALVFGPTGHVVGAIVGGIITFGSTELNAVRAQLKRLDQEFKQLRQDFDSEKQSSRLDEEVRQSQPGALPSAATARLGASTTSPPWQEIEPALSHVGRREPERALPTPRPGISPQHRPASVNETPEADFPAILWVREFLTGGNAVVRVGIVILLFGVAFLLRYLAEHSRLPIQWRLAGIVLSGIALLVVGWRLRTSRAAFAFPLQGGGLGILYLTIYAALRLYSLLPAALAFPLLGAVAVLSAVLAVLQNSLSLALLGIVGGFLAPVLASTGEGSHVVLFSYYALLNAGILVMAWFKAWRPLNLVGFVFTFGIGTVWGVLRYQPVLFASTEPFLVLYFLFYLTIAVLFSLRQPVNVTGYIDGIIVFGTPIVVFALQSALLHGQLVPLSYTAMVLSAVYAVLAFFLHRARAASQAMLVDAFIAIGAACATVAVPLALNEQWNVAAWSLEGTALIWIGCRQHRVLPRLAGTLLLIGCGLMVATSFDWLSGHAVLPLDDYLGVVLLSAASIIAACNLHRYRQKLRAYEEFLSPGLFWWGLLWWSIGSVNEIEQHWPFQNIAGCLVLLSITTLVCGEIRRRVGVPGAQAAAQLQLPLMLSVALYAFSTSSHPGVAAGWLAWPVAFVGLYVLMYRVESTTTDIVSTALNAGASWLLCGMLGWEAAFEAHRALPDSDVWSSIAWVLPSLLLLWQLPSLVIRVPWPFAKHRSTYVFLAGVGLAAFLYAWAVFANLDSDGDFAPLPYFPLVNPLDVIQFFVLLVLWRYTRVLRVVDSLMVWRIDPRIPIPALSGLAFLWVNAILLRTLHQWFGVPCGWDVVMESTLVQTSLSIFWALLSFVTMALAAKHQLRIVWLVGAALLGVVIAKLFLVDLSRVGSIERIVSFVGVGLLMLVIGYLCPLPPKAIAE